MISSLLLEGGVDNFINLLRTTYRSDIHPNKIVYIERESMGEMDYRFHAAHLDRGLTIHEAVPGGFNRAGEGL